jgi:hypothetical protein
MKPHGMQRIQTPRAGRPFAAARRAVGGLLATVALTASAGCGHTTVGTAQPAQTSASTTPTSTTPAIVPTVDIKGKLLALAQLDGVLGDTDMRPLASYTEPQIGTSGVDPFECRPTLLVATANAYFQKARQGMVGDTNRGAGGWVASQVISVFASRADPKAFLDSVASEWSGCIGKGAMTATTDPPQRWNPGSLEQTDDRIALTITRQDPPPRSCRHVVATQANIAVEVQVCGEGDTVGPANTLVAALLAKFPN